MIKYISYSGALWDIVPGKRFSLPNHHCYIGKRQQLRDKRQATQLNISLNNNFWYFEIVSKISQVVRFCEILRHIKIFICSFYWIHMFLKASTFPWNWMQILYNKSRVVVNITENTMEDTVRLLHTFSKVRMLRSRSLTYILLLSKQISICAEFLQ